MFIPIISSTTDETKQFIGGATSGVFIRAVCTVVHAVVDGGKWDFRPVFAGVDGGLVGTHVVEGLVAAVAAIIVAIVDEIVRNSVAVVAGDDGDEGVFIRTVSAIGFAVVGEVEVNG